MNPYIKKNVKDGRYHLYCGVCNKSNPVIKTLPAANPILHSIVCTNKCSPSGQNNPICSIRDIELLARRYGKTDVEIVQMIRDVCASLGIDSMQFFHV